MSIARAFTTRRNKAAMADSSNVARTQSNRKPINRNDISLPVNLISTTNMLSYNAPDISSLRHASSGSSASSSRSFSDSDAKSTSSANDTVLTDASSVGSSPVSPKPNHLSSYFEQANTKTKSTSSTPTVPAQSPRRPRSITNMQQRVTPEDVKKPSIPQRALSHSKSAHEHLARQRSLRNSASSPRLSQPRDVRSSADFFKHNDDTAHPFGKELEQLQEVVEEFGGVVSEASNDEDVSFMRTHRLAKFNAADYMNEIQPLYAGIFHKQVIAIQGGWI